jgi:hypothetical protein
MDNSKLYQKTVAQCNQFRVDRLGIGRPHSAFVEKPGRYNFAVRSVGRPDEYLAPALLLLDVGELDFFVLLVFAAQRGRRSWLLSWWIMPRITSLPCLRISWIPRRSLLVSMTILHCRSRQ